MNRRADTVVFWVILAIGFGLYGEGMYQIGRNHAALKCAEVPGKQVVSTTADTCTYANSFGRATTKRRAS